jgi:hypothetical protein
MNDDELRRYLKPRHSGWIEVAAFGLALLGSAAALAKWVFTAPTQEDYRGHDQRLKAVELDHAVLKATVDGLRVDVSKQDSHLEVIGVKIDKLLERRH